MMVYLLLSFPGCALRSGRTRVPPPGQTLGSASLRNMALRRLIWQIPKRRASLAPDDGCAAGETSHLERTFKKAKKINMHGIM